MRLLTPPTLALFLCGVPTLGAAQGSPAPAAAGVSDSLVVETSKGRSVVRLGDLERLGRQTARGTLHDAIEHEFSGFSLAAVLTRQGATLSGRGRGLADYLLVEAADSYRVVLSAAELDSTLTGKVPLLVDRLDGQPLTPKGGPWRVFVPGDRRPARWVRQVVRLRLASAP
jgi:hypothetical protein